MNSILGHKTFQVRIALPTFPANLIVWSFGQTAVKTWKVVSRFNEAKLILSGFEDRIAF